MTRLQHYADGRCSLPLWCYNDPELFSGQPARWYAQECFTGLTPPYRITRVGYWVAATNGDPSDPRIEVHGFNGVAPSFDPILPPTMLTAADLTPDYHEIAVDLMMAVDSFCIGVVGGDVDLGTALGLAVDDVTPPLGQSFYRVNGMGACNTLTEYRDVVPAMVYPLGQWCIDLDTQPM